MDDITTENILQELEEGDIFQPNKYEMSTIEIIYEFILRYIVSTAHLIACIGNLALSGLFFCSIYKFKILQTRTNFVLLHFMICIICYSILITTLTILDLYSARYYSMHYVIVLAIGFLTASFLFSLLLAIDWFLSANCNGLFAKYKKNYKWIITSIYVSVLTSFSILAITCPKFVNAIIFIICCIIYIISALNIVILNIIKRRKTYTAEALKTSYSFTVSSVFFLMWAPAGILLVISTILMSLIRHFPYEGIIILACLDYIIEFCAFCSPIVIVILLGRLDKNFRTSFESLFRVYLRGYSLYRLHENVEDCIDTDDAP